MTGLVQVARSIGVGARISCRIIFNRVDAAFARNFDFLLVYGLCECVASCSFYFWNESVRHTCYGMSTDELFL